MPLSKQLAAEVLGTFWLVLGGVGTAVLGLSLADGNVGILGVALAFGLTVVTGAYAFGHISGAHFNPAVSVGLWVGGRFPAAKVIPYVLAQAVGAIAAAAVVYLVASGLDSFSTSAGFASNGYGDHSPAGYSLLAAAVIEIVLTAVFVLVIHSATHGRAPAGFAPLAIGLTLTLIHLISIPVTNTSVNPARSLGPAIFAGGWALEQLWAFIVFPLVGAVLGGLLYRGVFEGKKADEQEPVEGSSAA
jgi:aquaporin Z